MFIKTRLRNALTGRSSVNLPISYWLLAIVRLLLSVIQNGYIHPDEYFQSLEVIAGDVFDIDSTRTWEFNTTFPLRNIALPKLTIGTSYWFMNLLNPYMNYFFHCNLKAPYLLVAAPRIVYCLISFINDYCLYKICVLYNQNYKNRLLLLASSYIILIYTTHTFSNSLEVVLFSVLLLVVSRCMLKSDRAIYHNEFLSEKYRNATSIVDKVKIYKLKSSLPEHSLSRCLEVATLSVTGIFNRPTFIGYAFPPIFFWLNRGLGSKFIGFRDFHFRMIALVIFGIPSLLLLILTDSVYYGFFTIAEVESLKVSLDNFVVTPLNFLKYNLLSDNLSEHGLHPRWLHITVNIPLLFNVLGVIAIVHSTKCLYRISAGSYSVLPRIQSITGLMLFSYITPVCLLSLFPHQEPRFLVPILIPIIFLYSPYIFANDEDSDWLKKGKRLCFIIWCISNALLTLFYGFLHQGGVYYLAKSMHSEIMMKTKMTTVHLVTSHIYNFPQSLLLMDSTSKLWYDRNTGQKYRRRKQFLLYEYGSLPLDKLLSEIRAINRVNDMKQKSQRNVHRLYLALPTSLLRELYETDHNFTDITMWQDKQFWPHLSTEAFPIIPSSDDFSCLHNFDHFNKDISFSPLNIFQRCACFFSKFSLSLINIQHKKYA